MKISDILLCQQISVNSKISGKGYDKIYDILRTKE